MSRIIYRHDDVERCVIGTVGNPGERIFFLQVRSARGFNSIVLEKSQVQALVERLQLMIRELRRNRLAGLKELNAAAIRDEQTLEYPISEDFRAGVIAISYEQGNQNIEIQIQAITDDEYPELISEEDLGPFDNNSELAPDLLLIQLSIPMVRGFIERASHVVAAGRTPCPFCGIPLNPEGHLCPRANGYRR